MTARLAAIAADRRSGATALVLDGVDVLTEAARCGVLVEAARAVCAAQPAMAGFRTAAAVALAARDPADALQALATRIRRTPAAVARHLVPLVRLRRDRSRVLTLVTCSRSALVERAVQTLAAEEPVHVCCARSMPGGEGLALAAALERAGISVDIYADSGIGLAVPGADAVVVGADAACGRQFVNKAGTAALAALARLHGVPVFVALGREKVLPPEVFTSLDLGEERAGRVRQPWFERVPADVVSAYVTDGGPLTPDGADSACLWPVVGLSKYLSAMR